MAGFLKVPRETEVVWASALGYFVWSMGQIEWQSYEWGRWIGGDTLKDRLIDQPGFKRRYEILTSAVEAESWPLDQKRRARLLWRKALGFSRFRNLIAHSPVIANRNFPDNFGIVDAKTMKGSESRYHPIYFAPIVYQTALKMQSLTGDLMKFIAEHEKA